jgi:hypothetical protein
MYSYFPDVRFVFLTSDLNQYRFKELATVDPSYPDVTIALPDSKVEAVVTKIIESISTSKCVTKWATGRIVRRGLKVQLECLDVTVLRRGVGEVGVVAGRAPAC